MFDHSKIDFTVEKQQLWYDNLEYTPVAGDRMEPLSRDMGVMLSRTDTNKPVPIGTEAYEPVQYKDIVSSVEAALNMSGMDMTDAKFETNVHDNGAKLELRAKFPAHSLCLEVRGNRDEVIPEFVFRTFHNRTWANNGMMGLWRGFCYNTLVSGDKLAYVYGRHTKNFSIPAFAAKIRAAGEYISNDGLKQMKDWYHTDVSRDNVINLFTHTLAKRTDNVARKTVANKVMLSNLMKIFDQENRHLHGRGHYEKYATRNAGTLWTAYQAATCWSSHDKIVGYSGNGDRPSHSTIGVREEKVRKMLHSPQWLQLAA